MGLKDKIKNQFNRLRARSQKRPRKSSSPSGLHQLGEKLQRTMGGFRRKQSSSPWSGKIQWQKLGPALFDPAARPRLQRLFGWGLLLGFAYTAGKVTSYGLQGKSVPVQAQKLPMAPSDRLDIRTETEKILMSNLFQVRTTAEPVGGEAPEQKNLENIPCLTAQRPSNLPITLLNTVVLQDEVKSVASVQVRSSQEPQQVRTHQKINSLAKVGRIERLKLIFRNLQSQDCEYIQSQALQQRPAKMNIISPAAGKKIEESLRADLGIKNEGNQFKICKSFLNQQMNDIGSLLTQAKADPVVTPDGNMAFFISELQPGGIFSKLGINKGDKITHINGRPVKSIQEIMQLFGDIGKISKLALTVERGGEELALDYAFDESAGCAK